MTQVLSTHVCNVSPPSACCLGLILLIYKHKSSLSPSTPPPPPPPLSLSLSLFLSSCSSYHPLSRSTLAYFHSSGLEGFTDIKGNPLPLVATPIEPSNISSDALQNGPYRIAVQLLGFIMYVCDYKM
jgi:hypothetical protein